MAVDPERLGSRFKALWECEIDLDPHVSNMEGPEGRFGLAGGLALYGSRRAA